MEQYKEFRNIMNKQFTGIDTVENKVYKTLKRAILNGSLKGNQQLKTDELASAFEVSRMPIREALHKLSSDGLVEFYPYKGANVAPTSVKEIEELTSVRIALEQMALRILIPVSDGWYDRMQDMIRQKYGLSSEKDYIESVSNTDFHRYIYTEVHHTVLKRLLNDLREKMKRYNYMIPNVPEVKQQMQSEHIEIINACVAGNYEMAAACMVKHLTNFKQKIIIIMENQELDIC